MKKLLIIPAVLAALALTACEETYDAVNGSVPAQVLVRDADDKIDNENVKRACADLGLTVQYVGNGKTAALVTCR